MALARSKVYRFVPIDTPLDISGDDVELSLDNQTWTTATHDDPDPDSQAQYLVDHPITNGGIRQWVRVLSDPEGTFAPRYGKQPVHVHVTDDPQDVYLETELDVPDD